MKKKGLIISTVVMVVVLIASLTTATYAWFTAASSVVVDSIKLEVTSDANVNVGVKKSTASPDSKTYDDYLTRLLYKTLYKLQLCLLCLESSGGWCSEIHPSTLCWQSLAK